MDQFENIRKNAELVIKVIGENNNVELGFDSESVEWLDGFIERQRTRADDETIKSLTSVLGSFLGECIRENYGGEWRQTENGLAVEFDGGNAVFPFNKTEKQFCNGSDDSVFSFYQTIPLVFNLNT